MRGNFITLEGLEGVGKTTNRAFVEGLLNENGISFVGTREPGGTELGETLRNLVLHAAGQMQDETELLLMTASRVEHVAKVIEPALSNGQWVLCDRFLDASIAYQGAGRELGVERVAELHRMMGVTLEPDLTLLLDMPVEAGLARMSARGQPDRIERETLAFFERARSAYLQRAADAPNRVIVIDASGTLDSVQASVKAAIMPLLERA
jgi:dTMP kinase